jgi:hypothetical protein
LIADAHGLFDGGLRLLVAIVLSIVGGSSPHLQPTGCFSQPSRCGYPDATNAGVPPSTELAPSPSIAVRHDGTTLDGLRITGTVTVAADDVTIQNSLIAPKSGGSGSYAVALDKGADRFTIRDSEIVGPAAEGGGLEAAVWNQHGNPGATAIRSYFHRCAVCWEGPGTFRDDYMVVDSGYPGSHDEDIYVCGGRVDVDHSTLVNTHEQTATVFGDTEGCGPNDFTVTNSLLAGGGFVLYPQANSEGGAGTTHVTGNRLARCVTAPVFKPASGGTVCRGGPDANGIFPNGGYFGVSAYYFGGAGQVWAGNFWDDDLTAVCPSGDCRQP